MYHVLLDTIESSFLSPPKVLMESRVPRSEGRFFHMIVRNLIRAPGLKFKMERGLPVPLYVATLFYCTVLGANGEMDKEQKAREQA